MPAPKKTLNLPIPKLAARFRKGDSWASLAKDAGCTPATVRVRVLAHCKRLELLREERERKRIEAASMMKIRAEESRLAMVRTARAVDRARWAAVKAAP